MGTGAKADQRLDLFVRQYEKLTDKHLPLAHPDNPFSRYLDRHFEAGLDSKDKAALAILIERGDCWLIHILLIKGFVQLYPFLNPAFRDKNRGNDLRGMIMTGSNSPRSYCHALKTLRQFSTWHDLKDFAPIDMQLELWLKNRRRSLGLIETARDIVSGLQFRFGTTAFCGDYPPSIKVILANANKPGGLILTKDEELYLIQRARLKGLYDNAKYRQAIAKINGESGPSDRFNQLLEISAQLRLHEFDGVLGYWQSVCNALSKIYRHY